MAEIGTTVLKATHVQHVPRFIGARSASSKTVDALMKLELPSGVDVEIKV